MGAADKGLGPVLAFSISQVLDRLRDDDYAVILLGSLSDKDGMRAIIDAATAPVLFLGTARQPDFSPMVEDSLSAETSHDEVVARLVGIAQISRPVNLVPVMRWGPLELNPGNRTARWQGRPLVLTSIQFRILETLMSAAGALVTFEALSRHIWGPHTHDDRERIVAHVRRIRKKIELDPSRPDFLLTVRGEGFRLAEYEVEVPPIDLTVFDLEEVRR